MITLARTARPFIRQSRSAAAPFVVAGILGLAASQASRLLADPDTQWHVALGLDMLARRTVPFVDGYSHTFAGAPFIAKEWLSQVILALALRIGGWPAVALLAALSLAAAFGLIYTWLSRRLTVPCALVGVLTSALFTAPHWLARPHILSLPVIVIWLAALTSAAERGRAPRARLLAVMALWANLHAGFTIGFAMAGFIAIDALLAAPPPARRTLALGWMRFLAAVPLAACLTPYGWRSMLVTVTLFGSGEPLPYIVEWQPLQMDLLGVTAVCSAVAVMLVLVIAGPRRNLARLALLALLCLMSLRHARFLELYALAAPILVATPLARLRPDLAAPDPVPADRSGLPVVAAFLVGLIALCTLFRPAEPPDAVRPTAALAAARRAGLAQGRVFNDYDFGGFLIAAGVKTFIDGRSDQIFLDGFTRTLAEATAAPEAGPFLALLAGRGVTWALVRTGSREARHCEAGGWVQIHADPVAAVYARP